MRNYKQVLLNQVETLPGCVLDVSLLCYVNNKLCFHSLFLKLLCSEKVLTLHTDVILFCFLEIDRALLILANPWLILTNTTRPVTWI